MKFENYFVADFENTTGGDSTYVYGFGIMNIKDDEPQIVENIDDAMNLISNVPKKSVIYFHNFATYDGWIIVAWLLKNGYTFTKNTNVNRRFNGIITDDRKIYQLKVRFKKYTVEFRDTCLLVQGKLDTIGKNFKCETAKLVGHIDYDKERGEGYVMDDEERHYLRNDVVLLKEILLKILDMGHLADYLTAGSFAFSEMKASLYQDMHGLTDDEMNWKRETEFYADDLQKSYRGTFPELPFEIDAFCRHAYRGGYCINWSDGEIYNGHGVVLDFNSLYPSVMVNKPYPYGEPHYFESELPDKDCFIVHIETRFSLREGCLPFIQIKGSPFYVENEYISNTNDEVELWLTSVDYRLFHDMYDVQYEEIIDGYWFNSYEHFFDHFVLRHYDAKKNAPDKTSRQTAKIILNSSYGKFGMRIARCSGIPHLNDKGTVSLELEDSNDMPKSTYIPVGAFVTAYGREKTIRHAVQVIDRLRYIDTDSLHLVDCTQVDAEKIFEIDPSEIGKLACESEFDCARWVRQKTYIERNVIEDGELLEEPKLSIKACGLTDDGKDMLKKDKEVFIKFTYGLKLEGSKLMKHTVEGGVNLHRVDFQIKK